MAIQAHYIMIASMDVDRDHEAVFNEIYDTEHVPNLLAVPGVVSVTRAKGEPFRMAIAGGVRDLPTPDPVYTAVYELESPDVVASDEWAAAVEKGRWPAEVRPYTRNRVHGMFKVI